MINKRKGLIFDLDQTLVDSSALEILRKDRDWYQVKKNVHKIKVFEGITELIEYAKLKDYVLGIVTNLPSMICDLYIEKAALDIKIRICYHDTRYHKPNPEPVLLAIERMGINQELSYGVGNDISDILAYNSAGIKSIFAKWSSFPAPEESSHIANNPLDLKNIIE
mgnify:CR=1 FL=1